MSCLLTSSYKPGTSENEHKRIRTVTETQPCWQRGGARDRERPSGRSEKKNEGEIIMDTSYLRKSVFDLVGGTDLGGGQI